MERRTLPTWGNATYLRAPSPSEGEGWGGGERSEKQPNWHARSTRLELESTVQAAIHGCFWTRPPHPALPLRGGGVFFPSGPVLTRPHLHSNRPRPAALSSPLAPPAPARANGIRTPIVPVRA